MKNSENSTYFVMLRRNTFLQSKFPAILACWLLSRNWLIKFRSALYGRSNGMREYDIMTQNEKETHACRVDYM